MARLIEDGWIKSYLKYTQSNESPEVYHLWSGIAIVAGALRDRVYLERGYSRLYPNLFVVLCGPTGCKKSTACEIGLNLLRCVDGIRIAQDKITPERLITFLGKPQASQITDSQFKYSYAGFLYAPEFATLLGSVNYASTLLETLTKIYDGSRLEYRTRTKEDTILENVNLNFLGASTPEWLSKGLTDDSFAGGFLGRIIFVMQTKSREKWAFPELSDEQKTLEDFLKTDLQTIANLQGGFTITTNAKAAYIDWYNTFEPDYSSRLAGYYQRKPTHILKLAMILAASSSDTLTIRDRHIRACITLLDQVEQYMPDAFAYIGATNEARIAQHIIASIHENKGMITKQKLVSKVRHLIRNMREFEEIINTLKESGIILQSNTGGTHIYMFTKVYLSFLEKKRAVANVKPQDATDVVKAV